MITKEMIEVVAKVMREADVRDNSSYWDQLGVYWNDENTFCYEDDAKKALTEAYNLSEKMTQSKWQPIETAPRDGTEIIITNGYEIYTAMYRKGVVVNDKPWFAKSAGGDFFNDGYDHENIPVYMYKPTHWMPLPPIGEGNE